MSKEYICSECGDEFNSPQALRGHRHLSEYKWTKKEVKTLKEKYPTHGADIKELDRSKWAIYLKANKLGLERKGINWSKEEVEILKERYPIQGSDIEELDRSRSAIINKANKLGIEKRKRWTKEEVKILKEKYETSYKKELLTLLPDRTWSSIKSKATRLDLSRLGSPDIIKAAKENIKKAQRVAKEINTREWVPEWNKHLTYILGVLDGDGWCYRNRDTGQYTVGLEVKDKEFRDKFSRELREIGLKPYLRKRRREHNHKGYFWKNTMYIAHCYSRMFCDWYKQFNREEIIENSTKEMLWKYIEGLYESDGSSSFNLIISSVSQNHRNFIKKALSILGVRVRGKGINIYIKDRSKFFDKVEPIIERKSLRQ